MEKHGKSLEDRDDSDLGANGFNNLFYQDDRNDLMVDDGDGMLTDEQNDFLMQQDMEDDIAMIQQAKPQKTKQSNNNLY
jgi:hypothetical protein